MYFLLEKLIDDHQNQNFDQKIIILPVLGFIFGNFGVQKTGFLDFPKLFRYRLGNLWALFSAFYGLFFGLFSTLKANKNTPKIKICQNLTQ